MWIRYRYLGVINLQIVNKDIRLKKGTQCYNANLQLETKHLQDLLELTSKKDVLFITGDWKAKVGSEETPGVTGKFGLGVKGKG